MTILVQADTITALEHLILAVIDKASVGGMFLLAFVLGYIAFPLSMQVWRRWGVRMGK